MIDRAIKLQNESFPPSLIDTSLAYIGVAETQNERSYGSAGTFGTGGQQGARVSTYYYAGVTGAPLFTGIFVLLGASWAANTGSRLSFNQTGSLSLGSPFPTISFVEEEKRAVTAIAPAAHQRMLRQVRDAFRLSMTDLAGVFHVSRTAAYDWLKGAAPRSEQMERLIKLNEYATLVESRNIQRIDLLSKLPLHDGKTLLQLLSSDDDIRHAIDEIEELSLQRSKSMEHRRQLTAEKKRPYRPDNTTPSFISFE